MFFFFQAEDGIRDRLVTGVQTCALPIWRVTLTSVGEPAGASPADAAGEDTFKIRLELSKSIFSTAEGIEVEFTLPVLDDSAWIGVVPAGIAHGDEAVNDQHDIEFRHLEGRTIGGFTFANPGVGDWSIRLNDDDDSGNRSEERRGGKECRSRWSPHH